MANAKKIRDLVCNSHDADASKVRIDFFASKIVIEDDGVGIPYEMLENWLVAGQSTKPKRAKGQGGGKSAGGRRLRGGGGTGRKGIISIGEQVKITSGSHVLKYGTAMDAILYLAPIPNEQGTTIEISKLTSKWNSADLIALYSHIIRLYRLMSLPKNDSCEVSVYKGNKQQFSITYKGKGKVAIWGVIIYRLVLLRIKAIITL